jgi:lipopolysaccharide O-acetyltransferase
VRRQIADERRNRAVAARVARSLTPPPPRAYAHYGKGTWIVPPARVTRPDCISLGDGVVILEHSWLSVVEAIDGIVPKLTIGDGCRISEFFHIACVGEITLGRECLIGARTLIGDTYHRYDDPTLPVMKQPMADPKPVRIGDGVHIGIGCSILMGVTIGDGAYVGAAAVVTKDVPPLTVVVGNPARPVRRYDEAAGEWIPWDG